MDWPRLISLVAAGRYPVQRVVTGQLAVSDVVGQGFEALCDPGGPRPR